MKFLKELSELVKNEVISEDISLKIQNYYGQNEENTTNRLFIVFGVLGSILIGLGIILILAHNWDDLSRFTKTIFAILPLLIGQGICIYTLSKKTESPIWKEASAVFLFFAIGSSISLISQIYNIPGRFTGFMLTWMLLSLPLIYLLKSSVVALLYIVGITIYATEGYDFNHGTNAHFLYWIWIFLAMPHFYKLFISETKSNFLTIATWFIPISITIILGAFANESPELLFIAYISLFAIFYLLGRSKEFKSRRLINNGFLIIGSLGTIILLLILSFDDSWSALHLIDRNNINSYEELLLALLLSGIAASLLFFSLKRKSILEVSPMSYTFVIYLFIYLVGMSSDFGAFLINLLLFGLSLWIIREGARNDHFGILNYGLLIITALIICRFFDSNLSFVFRGLMFVLVGIGFFGTNIWMIKKRRKNEN